MTMTRIRRSSVEGTIARARVERHLENARQEGRKALTALRTLRDERESVERLTLSLDALADVSEEVSR